MTHAGLAHGLLTLMMLAPLAGAADPRTSPRLPAAADRVTGLVCSPLPPLTGRITRVSTVPQLVRAVERATPGTSILLADGTYNLDGAYLRLDTPDVTIRSASGDRRAVILDGNGRTREIVQVAASGVTIADLTLRQAYNHPVHVVSAIGRDTTNTLIYNVHLVDPGQQAVKINPVEGGGDTDGGTIACSHLELTEAGRARVRDHCYTGGIDAHQSRDWVIRDNVIEGFWCASGLAEHGIHFWKTSRDPVVERNVLRNNARGIGFGMATSGTPRAYPDDACPGVAGYVDHYRGVIRNNVVTADDPALFQSSDGFDGGISLWNACGVQVFHNTVYTANPSRTFAAIEWRFANTRADLANNLVNHVMRARDGARVTEAGNVTSAHVSWFVNANAGDLHLVPTATEAIDRVTAPRGVRDDMDGNQRPAGGVSDVGADEVVTPIRRPPPR